MLTRPGARIWRHSPKALVFYVQCEEVVSETPVVVTALREISLHLVPLPSH